MTVFDRKVKIFQNGLFAICLCDIFKLYQTRTQEYDNKIGVGADKNVITYKDFTVSYMLNPKSNMTVSLGVTNRTQKCDVHDDKNQWMYFVGFRTNLNNFYYDF